MKGGVSMPVPATTGKLKAFIQDMQIGDYIIGSFKSGVGWQIGDTQGTSEIPVTGTPASSPNGYFYYIKVSKGLLIADRVVHHSVSWDSLNSNSKAIQGFPIVQNGVNGIIRSLTGGVAYADSSGNKSTTDLGYGAFPVNNEWDKFIVNFPQELIQSGKTLDDVFHYGSAYTWIQDTPINVLNTSDKRIIRGYVKSNHFGIDASATSSTIIGFRPVFEYIES